MKVRANLMKEEDMIRALKRISHQILERNHGAENIVLIGIKSGGIPIAQILAENIKNIEGIQVPTGALDITYYRDDLAKEQKLSRSFSPSSISAAPFDITGKDVILVDDVLYTGRTVRAALDAVLKWGRASTIQLAVLIDRGHRELPIRADYVGKNVPTSRSESVAVYLSENDDKMGVLLLEKEDSAAVR